MKNISSIGLIAVASVALCATSAMAAKDKFNRSTLGSDWQVPYPTLSISNNQLVGTSLALGYDSLSSSDSAAKAIVNLNGTDLEYGAVAVGNVANGTNAFIKIQEQNSDGMFEYGGFYVGNNSGVSFFALNSTVPSPATLSVSICGTVAVMKIKSSAGTQKYSYDYGSGYNFGTGGGLGTYGNISLDNYKSGAAKCRADLKGATVIKGSNARDLSLSK